MEPISPATNSLSPSEPGELAFIVYGALALGLVAMLLWVAGWLGEKRPGLEKAMPYECGVVPTGTGPFRYPIAFYLVAAFFLVFDVEAAFIFAWAVAFDRLGWSGWLQISFFIVILLASLIYLWKKGGLEWGPPARKARITRGTSS